MQPNMSTADARAAAYGPGVTDMARMVMTEIPYQRMHRYPVRSSKPLDLSDNFVTMNQRTFPTQEQQPAKPVPRFTVGRKNDLGTSNILSSMTLDELRVGQISLADKTKFGSGTWRSNMQQSFQRPEQSDPLRGSCAPRQGVAAWMPFSEVERNFGTLDSTGTMPGESGARRLTSTNQEHFAQKELAPRRKQQVTLGFGNDIGSKVNYETVGGSRMSATNYSISAPLPRSFHRFSTSTQVVERDHLQAKLRAQPETHAHSQLPTSLSNS